MKRYNVKWLIAIIISNLLTVGITSLVIDFRSSFDDTRQEVVPSKIFLPFVMSPDGKSEAAIVASNDGSFLNGDRFFLVLRSNDTEILVNRELSEGFGTYEAGIHSVSWVNTHEVSIERTVCNIRDTLNFDIHRFGWTKHE